MKISITDNSWTGFESTFQILDIIGHFNNKKVSKH